MKVKELKIGNYLFFEKEIQQVSSIHSDETIRLKANADENCHGCYSVTQTNIKPIPITEEWLIKFGYVKFKSNEIYNEWGLIIDGILKYKIIETVNYLKNNSKFTIPNSDKPIMIQYIHQLQNLYFVLTGEELCK